MHGATTGARKRSNVNCYRICYYKDSAIPVHTVYTSIYRVSRMSESGIDR